MGMDLDDLAQLLAGCAGNGACIQLCGNDRGREGFASGSLRFGEFEADSADTIRSRFDGGVDEGAYLIQTGLDDLDGVIRTESDGVKRLPATLVGLVAGDRR